MAKTTTEILRDFHEEIKATQRYLWHLKKIELALAPKRRAATTRRRTK